jgi:hypothetical protein
MNEVAITLTNEQRQQLCEMIAQAFLDMRGLALQGKTQQAFDLADAFHNLPVMMWSSGFKVMYSRSHFSTYQQYHAETNTDYVAMHDAIFGEPKA